MIVSKNDLYPNDQQQGSLPADNCYDNLPAGNTPFMQYLRDLMKSILEVDDNYYRVEYEDERVEAQEQYERVFAYELYHQWSKFIDVSRIPNSATSNLCINGEIKKIHQGELKVPDLVLHKRSELINSQYIIVEIKRGSQIDKIKNPFDDIVKLYGFITGQVREGTGIRYINDTATIYNLGVFIVTDYSIERLKNLFKDKSNEIATFSSEIDNAGTQLYCICIPKRKDGTLQYCTLNELI